MGVTHVYIADIRHLPSEWQGALPGIAPLYQARATGESPEDNRRSEFVAGLLLAQILGVVSDDQIVHEPAGKPVLTAGQPSFNISHGGSLVVLAVSETDTGIDVERIPDDLGLMERAAAQRIFSPEELNAIAQAHKEAPRLFARLWTGKEAILKARGCGFELDPREHPNVFTGWALQTIEHDGRMISVAQRTPFELELVSVDVQTLVQVVTEEHAPAAEPERKGRLAAHV